MKTAIAKIDGSSVHLTVEDTSRQSSTSPFADESFAKSCRIENLITDYESQIKITTKKYGRWCPYIGTDNFEAAVYFKIVTVCRSGGSLVQATEEHEAKLMSLIIKTACQDECRRWGKNPAASSLNAIESAMLNQLDENCDRRLTARSSVAIDKDWEPIRAKLDEKGVVLTERQLSILAERLAANHDGKARSYSEIGQVLSISEATVKREFNKIRQVLQNAAHGVEDAPAKYTKAGQTRARYEALLRNPEKWKLTARQTDYMTTYLELSQNGKPASTKSCARGSV